jgi:GntR family transcriptional regulator, transcriptional repressor for pyruvate dehydrogenase complex
MPTSATVRRTVPREIAEALRTKILRGELKAGELLPPERELALALGTNRNSLREALRSLEAQGLIQARQGQGVRVRDFKAIGEIGLLADYLRVADPVEQIRLVTDLLDIRQLVSRAAVVRAGELADRDDRERLEAGLEQLRGAVEIGQSAVMEAELGLYRALVLAGKSLAATWLFNSLENTVRSFGQSFPGLWVTAPGFVASWEEVVAAIAVHDSKRAEQKLMVLLRATDELVLQLLGVESPSARVPTHT